MHAAVAAEAVADKPLVDRVIEDHTTAPISDKLRATLTFLKKLTLEPAEVRAADARAVLDQGVSRQAMRDAIYICFIFCIYDRIADVLDWDVPSSEALHANARMLVKIGYR